MATLHHDGSTNSVTAAATHAQDTASSLSADGRAILLLCGHFGVRAGMARPLTPAEYHAFAEWLERHSLTPASLLGTEGALHLDAYAGNQTDSARLARLLDRETELDAALARWENHSIWVVSERDGIYPWRLRRRIKTGGFPLLFGAGPKTWLNDGGLCVVGSRDCTDAGRRFARRLGERCAEENIPVISSDMRGIDRETVNATLRGGGCAINVLADSLEKSVTARRNRGPLAAGRLTMVTPFAPSSRFSVSNAMRANKYQYSLADAAVVVESRQTGGIWSGADENRREGWVPGFVRIDEDASPGNRALLHLGLAPVTSKDLESAADLRVFFARQPTAGPPVADRPDLYGAFADGLSALLRLGPCSESEIMNHFEIERAQARKWLDRAVAERRIEREGRPARYRSTPE